MAFKRTYRSRRRLKAGRKIARFVKRGWNTYKRNRGAVGQLVRDVAMVKSLVNAEKKYISFTETFNFGLINNNSSVSGHFVQALISIGQGTTASTRTGNSIKPTSLQYAFNITPQTSQSERIPYNIYILLHPGPVLDDVYTTGSNGTIAGTFLSGDYGGLNTTRSLRNVERFREWIILKKIRGQFSADESSTSGNERREHVGAVKLYKHMKFNGSNTPVIQNQLYYLFVAGAGDIGTAASALTVQSMYRLHYLDN